MPEPKPLLHKDCGGEIKTREVAAADYFGMIDHEWHERMLRIPYCDKCRQEITGDPEILTPCDLCEDYTVNPTAICDKH